MKKTSLDLLNEIITLGIEKEHALEGIDAALDDEFGYENRKELKLYDAILTGFKCEVEAKKEMKNMYDKERKEMF